MSETPTQKSRSSSNKDIHSSVQESLEESCGKEDPRFCLEDHSRRKILFQKIREKLGSMTGVDFKKSGQIFLTIVLMIAVNRILSSPNFPLTIQVIANILTVMTALVIHSVFAPLFEKISSKVRHKSFRNRSDIASPLMAYFGSIWRRMNGSLESNHQWARGPMISMHTKIAPYLKQSLEALEQVLEALDRGVESEEEISFMEEEAAELFAYALYSVTYHFAEFPTDDQELKKLFVVLFVHPAQRRGVDLSNFREQVLIQAEQFLDSNENTLPKRRFEESLNFLLRIENPQDS